MKSLLRLIVTNLLFGFSFFAHGQEWQLTQTIDEPTASSAFEAFGYAIAMDGNIAVVGAPGYTNTLPNEGRAYIYELQNGTWTQIAHLAPSTPASQAAFGSAIDIEGDVIVVGAPAELGGNGAVYVWEKPASGWGAVGIEDRKIVGFKSSDANNLFGNAVDLHGDELLIGAKREEAGTTINHGIAYLYSKGADWSSSTPTATFYHPVGSGKDFGISVGLHDDYAAVGALAGTNAGNVLIFEKGAGWVNKTEADAILRKSNRANLEAFGVTLVVNEDRVVVGTRNTPSVFIYERPTIGWEAAYDANGTLEEIYSINSTLETDDGFGESLAIYGDRLLIGAKHQGDQVSRPGHAYIYRLGETSAVLQDDFPPISAMDGDLMGFGVAMYEDQVLISAPYKNTSGQFFSYKGSYNLELSPSLCFGETYDFDGQTLTSSGTYTKFYTTTDSFDSLVTVNLTVNPQLNFAFNFDPIKCNGETGGITFDSPTGGDGGPYAYSVDGGNTFHTNPVFSNVSAGAKTLVLKDGLGCTRSEGTFLSEPAELLISGVSSTNVSCNGEADGQIVLNVTGGSNAYYYSLDGTNFTFNGAGINTQVTISNLMAGNYTVHIKDGNDCEITINRIISEPSGLATAISVVDATCSGSADGSISITASGGTGNLTYSLNGSSGQSSNQFFNLDPGTYAVTITDQNDCSITITDVVVGSDVVITPSATVSDVDCNGEASGSLSIGAAGGVSPYQYSLDGVDYQQSPDFENLVAGVFDIFVKDVNGCLGVESVTISEPDELTVSVTQSGDDFTLSATGGTGPYEYSLDGTTFQSSPNFENLDGGLYTFIVLDANGCTVESDGFNLVLSSIRQQLKMYPNPVDDVLTVEGAEFDRLTIYDLGGNQLINSRNREVNVSQLKSGLYLVSLKDSKGETILTQRMVKH